MDKAGQGAKAVARVPGERHEPSLIRRLLLAVAVTLLVSGAVAYFVVPRLIEERYVAEQTAAQAADARSLARAARVGTRREGMREVSARLRDIAGRPGVELALLIDRRGRVVAAGERSQVGERDTEPFARAVARGTGSGAELAEREQGDLSFVAPVRVGSRRLALQVDRDGAELSQAVDELRVGLILFVLVGLPLSLPIFYLVGGRRVNALHRAALQRARRDGLTDLENHRAFKEELHRAVADAARHRTPLELAVIDVDDFKFVNDRHGHLHGDRVLAELSRILSSARQGDRAFRIGGDEFALLLPRTDRKSARTALERVRSDIAERLPGVTVSIGHAAAAKVGERSDALWGRADSAVYEAKRRGRNVRVSFGDMHRPDPVVTMEQARALRALMDDGQVGMAFQPIWDLGTETVLGYEALARPTASYGLEGPLEAFRVAESIGHECDLDAICRAAALRRAGELPADSLLFLNFAPCTLTQMPGAADRLREGAGAVGLDPGRLVVEISERSGAAVAAIVPEVTRLRELGFKVALDDVGAGNSGLEMLRRLTVDFVKIDRAVIASALEDRAGRAMLVSIVSFAREIEAFVIAEGIETPEMLALVREAGGGGIPVQGAQGYLLGRPQQVLETGASLPARGDTFSEPERKGSAATSARA